MGTGLKDNAKNRQRAEARAVLISEEMERDSFEYLKWFPNGNRAHLFRSGPARPNVDASQKTVRQYYEEWIKGKKPPLVRKSRERDYRQAFNKHILPFFGDMPVSQITPRKLEDFRIHLLEQAKLSLKTARNIIDAYLRAMMRDARNVDHLNKRRPLRRAGVEETTQGRTRPVHRRRAG